jgi:hypothetical protein
VIASVIVKAVEAVPRGIGKGVRRNVEQYTNTPGHHRMTSARSQRIATSVDRWYHCVTGCVRRAFLLGEGPHDRKGLIENRLEELGGCG